VQPGQRRVLNVNVQMSALISSCSSSILSLTYFRHIRMTFADLHITALMAAIPVYVVAARLGHAEPRQRAPRLLNAEGERLAPFWLATAVFLLASAYVI
jgi:hypothetical protein